MYFKFLPLEIPKAYYKIFNWDYFGEFRNMSPENKKI